MRKTLTSAMAAAIIGLWCTPAHAQQNQPLAPNADYDAKYRVDQRAIGNFIRVVYRSLKN